MERLIKIGEIKPKKSCEIAHSRIGLGFEKLDRNIFDPNKAYPFVGESGVKWARLQSGWMRTEKEKGGYDFAWLDDIVDHMIAMGVEPWLCLCYGNPVYTPVAAQYFGAVGCPPIATEEERTGWANYVRATVTHFKGRIHYYEVWNEPDLTYSWKHGVNPQEFGEFTIATAKICREVDPTCEVLGFVLANKKIPNIVKPFALPAHVMPWMASPIMATIFSCMDMVEALRGLTGDVKSYLDYGYFGVIGADFDDEGHSTGEYTPKPSYKALQSLTSVFCNDYELYELPVIGTIEPSIRVIGMDDDFALTRHYGFAKPNGSYALCYWMSKNILTETYESTISLKFKKADLPGEIRLADLRTGDIYELTEEMVRKDGEYIHLVNIPVTDSPLLLTFGEFIC